ncbi:hypothetical protein EJB05_26700, partial [Eragrostis curvula]
MARRERGHRGARRKNTSAFGNVVLWARPAATAKNLTETPLGHAAELASRVDGRYCWSFINFACSGGVEAKRPAPTADHKKMLLRPDVEVYSLLGFAFCDIDFGSSAPFFGRPSHSHARA